jgi:Zn-dependent protease with chaperone function
MEQSPPTPTETAPVTLMSVLTGVFAIIVAVIVLYTLASSNSILAQFIALLIAAAVFIALAFGAIMALNRR